MKKKYLVILLVIIPTIFLNVHATEQLTVWVENYPPFGYEIEGEIQGLSTDVTREILKRAKIQAESWRIAAWKDAYKITLNRPNSLLYTVVRKPDREDKFHWIGPIADRRVYLYKVTNMSGNVIKDLNSLEDVKKYGYTIGAVEKTAAAEYYKRMGVHVETVKNYYQNILKLHLGRIDLISAVEPHFNYLVKKHGLKLDNFAKALMDDNSKKYYIAVNLKTDSKIVQSLQSAFKTIQDDGTLQRIQHKHLHEEYSLGSMTK